MLRISCSGLVVLTALPCVSLIARALHAQDASYISSSSHVYDEARVLDPTKFTRSSLLEQFRSFAALECSGKSLARLILAPTQEELGKVTNVSFVLDDLTSAGVDRLVSSNPSLLGQGVRRLSVAQLLCIAGESTAHLRIGGRVEQYRLSGTGDSRRWNVGQAGLTLVGFNLRSGGREWISAFVRTKVLPDLNSATAIREDLEHRTGVQTYLILRTDPFFWDMDGPKFDPFDVPVPRISGKEFLTRPYISCPPSDNGRPCRLETLH